MFPPIPGVHVGAQPGKDDTTCDVATRYQYSSRPAEISAKEMSAGRHTDLQVHPILLSFVMLTHPNHMHPNPVTLSMQRPPSWECITCQRPRAHFASLAEPLA